MELGKDASTTVKIEARSDATDALASLPAKPEEANALEPAGKDMVVHKLKRARTGKDQAKLLTTATKLRLLLALILTSACILALVSTFVMNEARKSLRTITAEQIPALKSGEEIRSNLIQMDNYAVNEVIAASQSVRQKYSSDYESKMHEVIKLLIGSTADGKGRQSISELMIKLQKYTGMIETAHAYEQLHAPPAKTLINASNMLREDIFDQVSRDLLANGNSTEEISQVSLRFQSSILAIYCCLAVLLFMLCFTQDFVRRKMRRQVNIWLLSSTVLTMAVSFLLAANSRALVSTLDAPRSGGIAAMHKLLTMRTLANEANDMESLQFLDKERITEFSNIFDRIATGKPAPLKDTIPEHPVSFLLPAVAAFGDSKNLQQMQQDWALYVSIDGQIRLLLQNNKTADATELCLGHGEQQSNGVFTRFENALNDVLASEEKMLESETKQAMSILLLLQWALPTVALAIAAAAYFGIDQRLKEYRL